MAGRIHRKAAKTAYWPASRRDRVSLHDERGAVRQGQLDPQGEILLPPQFVHLKNDRPLGRVETDAHAADAEIMLGYIREFADVRLWLLLIPKLREQLPKC